MMSRPRPGPIAWSGFRMDGWPGREAAPERRPGGGRRGVQSAGVRGTGGSGKLSRYYLGRYHLAGSGHDPTENPLASPSTSTTDLTPTDLRRSTVTLPGKSMAEVVGNIVDVGEGRPIVFLHGLVGLNEHWEDVVHRAKRRCRCVMLELPLLD